MANTSTRYDIDVDLDLGQLPEQDSEHYNEFLSIHNAIEQLALTLGDFIARQHAVTIVDDTMSPYTVLITDRFIKIDTTIAAVTLILPVAATATGLDFEFKHVAGGNPGTVEGDGAETIDTVLNFTTSLMDAYPVKSDGTEYWINK